MDSPFFVYSARLHDGVKSVYDGDTVRLDVDLGHGIWIRNEPYRLYGINAPELRGWQKAGGVKARDWLRDRLAGETITIQTVQDKKGKYGRYLAALWIGGQNVNREMVELGLAVENFYGSARPEWW